MSHIRNLEIDFPSLNVTLDSLELPESGVLVIKGPSGCGKSSFLRVLMGFDSSRNPQFSWIFRGQELSRRPPWERRLGVVFQTGNTFPHLTGGENIWMGAHQREVQEDQRARAQELISLFHLERILDKKAVTFSIGEQQRIALVRALLSDPQLLLLDEPFSALDEANSRQGRDMLRQSARLLKIPIWMVTHSQEDVDSLADHLWIFPSAKISSVESGPTA